MSSSSELRARVLAEVASAPSRTRAQTLLSRLWLFAGAAAGALAIFLSQGGVRPTGRPPLLVTLTTLGTTVSVAAGMYVLFTRRSRSMLRRPAWVLGVATALSVVAFLAWRYEVSSTFGLVQRWPERVGLRCLRLALITGSLPLFAALLAWRRTDPLAPAATGAAFGAGAGLATAVLTDLWCPVSYVPHLLLGHVLPILILAAIGSLVGHVALRVSRRRDAARDS
jgi:hypothetical protein